MYYASTPAEFTFDPSVPPVEESLDPDSHDVTGYQVGGETQYSVDIHWSDDMTFVYDRGVFNSDTGNIYSAFENADADSPIQKEMVQKGGTTGTINQWLGFDGVRNRVVVVNRSNAALDVSYAAMLDTSVVGTDAKTAELYALKSDASDYIVSATDANNSNFNDDGDKLKPFGEGRVISSDTKKSLGTATDDGNFYDDKVFLNLTGAPIESFTTDSQQNATIGTITVTFSKDTTDAV